MEPSPPQTQTQPSPPQTQTPPPPTRTSAQTPTQARARTSPTPTQIHTSKRPRRRAAQLEEIAEGLPQRANTLSKLFLSRSSVAVSRTEVGVLRSLLARPRRITELASEERVTQPAITLLVNRLAGKGWVERIADASDRRAVLVSLTPAGEEAFRRVKAEYHALLHEEIAALDDHEVATLAESVEILDRLIERLRLHDQ